mmetsp:Transcript_125707/g.326418  ORF Transcript_125707/g.326418 Transcript_125707/m.326418 type:complete len:216 (-) Transcript_125707:745-1392(-)
MVWPLESQVMLRIARFRARALSRPVDGELLQAGVLIHGGGQTDALAAELDHAVAARDGHEERILTGAYIQQQEVPRLSPKALDVWVQVLHCHDQTVVHERVEGAVRQVTELEHHLREHLDGVPRALILRAGDEVQLEAALREAGHLFGGAVLRRRPRVLGDAWLGPEYLLGEGVGDGGVANRKGGLPPWAPAGGPAAGRGRQHAIVHVEVPSRLR